MKHLICGLVLVAMLGPTAARAGGGFEVVALGARGGIQDGNLSAYLVRPSDSDAAVTCDAGALVAGLKTAEEKGAFDAIEVPDDSSDGRIGYVLTERIKGYLVSHAHLDHIAGLVAASPDDSAKPIYALTSVNERIERDIFNWDAWPNFGDRGKAPQLKKYRYSDLDPGKTVPLDGTAMQVTAFPLSHGGVESTAFLIESGDDALLCFGDTGPDEVEKATRIADIWDAVAEKAKAGHLRGIIIETSYTNAQPDDKLFGHLTPDWLLKSLRGLADRAGGKDALAELPVVVSHIKYSLKKGDQPQVQILKELEAGNDLGVKFIIPEQGDRWRF